MTRARTVGTLVLAGALAGCAPEPVVLGVTTGLTTAEAALMALEDARAAGLVVPVDTVIVVEAENRAAPAVRAADSLVSTPGLIAVLGHSNSAASLTAAPIYNQAGVVQIASHSTADLYSEAGRYSFRMVPPDRQQGQVLARFLAREFGDSRVALAYVNDDYGRGLRQGVLGALPDGAVTIVADVPHISAATPGTVDNTVLGIIESRPDVLLWLGRIYRLQSYLPEIREALGRIPVVGGDALNPVETLPDPEGLFPPMHFVRLLDLEARPETRRFAERYRQRVGKDPTDAAALAYDAFGLLLAGVGEGVRTGEEMRVYLNSLGRERPPYPGITGSVEFDEDGDAYRQYVMGHLLGGSGGGLP